MTNLKNFLCALLLLLIFVSILNESWALEEHNQKIKILIGKFETFAVQGSGLALRFLDQKDSRSFVATEQPLTIVKKNSGISVNGKYFDGEKFLLTSSQDILTLNSTTYSGSIFLVCENEKSMLLINEINLERYLDGLLTLELPQQWELAVMKAQAVAARTYALYHRTKNATQPYHLQSSVLSQVYNGIENEEARARQAVLETTGEIVTYNGLPIMAAYHGCCGGRTAAAKDVWGKDEPYLISVFCGMCTIFQKYFWQLQVSRGVLEQKLSGYGYNTGSIKSFGVIRRSRDNRVQQIMIGGKRDYVLRGNELRLLLGSTALRSTNFIIKTNRGNSDLQFLGTGYGHGVGLCQWGARGRALRGDSYQEILRYYYPGTKVEKIY